MADTEDMPSLLSLPPTSSRRPRSGGPLRRRLLVGAVGVLVPTLGACAALEVSAPVAYAPSPQASTGAVDVPVGAEPRTDLTPFRGSEGGRVHPRTVHVAASSLAPGGVDWVSTRTGQVPPVHQVSQAPSSTGTATAKPVTRVGTKPVARAGTKPAIKAAAIGTHAATGNPLAHRPWGVYKGGAEMAWYPYTQATGHRKELLAKIALAPKAKWFGAWIADRDIATKVKEYITNTQGGNPNTLVQMTVFRSVPWEHEACTRLPTRAEKVSYKRWVDNFAAAVGATPTAIVLQPDGPFALCVPGGVGAPTALIAYAAKKLSALPNTSVYIEAGAADWPAAGQGGVPEVLKFLIPSGVAYARGFALNGTHYSSTVDEVARGAAIVEALAEAGIAGKRFVVNTSSNGQPFTYGTYQGPDGDNAWVCRSKKDPRTCVALGIPPTWKVSAPRWGLPAATRALAAAHVDGYVWFGRPWLYRQNEPFVMGRALQLARTSRW
jgi:endoglucanase